MYEQIQRLVELTNKYVWFLFSGVVLYNMMKIHKKCMENTKEAWGKEDNNIEEAWGVIVNAAFQLYLIFILATRILGF